MAENVTAIFEGKAAEEFLKKLKLKTTPSVTLFKQLGGVISANVFKDIIDHFSEEEGEDGPWTDWSSSYVQQMFSKGKSGNRILQDTGRLRNSFKPSNYRAEEAGILFFNNAATKGGFPYAAAHDIGGPKLPQRKFMWLSDMAMESIAEQTLKWITDVN